MNDNNKGEPMSLAEKLNGAGASGKQFCTVGVVLDRLPEDDLIALIGALENEARWPATDLAELLATEGQAVNFRHIRQHRKGHGLHQCAHPELGRITK